MNSSTLFRDLKSSRRKFLSKSGLGLLIGYAFDSRTGLAQTVKTPNTDRFQSVNLTTHEWHGDIKERIDFPRDWKIDVRDMAGYNSPVLTSSEIIKLINNPVGTKPLREIAAGKKTAVILFDDITRATPTSEIAPLVVDELRASGIRDENILFICMIGSHLPVSDAEARAKLGDDIIDNYAWSNHNCLGNLTTLGKSSLGNEIKINTFFVKADVKISISGVKEHWGPGYGGGPKSILPGVSSLDTITYNHTEFGQSNPTSARGKIYNNQCRQDMIEAARLAGLDFTVQLLLNGERKIIGVYAGDVVEAHEKAAIEANKLYETKLAQNADIVITNTYPRTTQETGYNWMNLSLRPGGTGIIIRQCPVGIIPDRYRPIRGTTGNSSFWDQQRTTDPIKQAGQVIIFSQYTPYRDIMNFPKEKYRIVKTWDDVLALLAKSHGPSTNVAIYPYIGVQHEPLSLSG